MKQESIAKFNEGFGQGQTLRQGIGQNHNKSAPYSKMSNKQQCGKLTEINKHESRRQKACIVNETQHAQWISKLG